MATAEELLNGLTGTTDKILVVDNDLRTIIIPDGVKNLGVESDIDVLKLKIRMPRYVSDTDLSNFSIRVNYSNAKNESDVYTVSNPTITSDTITFTWLVGRIATRVSGKTKFNICAIVLDSEGNIDREFNTEPVYLEVLDGLEASSRAVTLYSDVIEQWRQELFGIGDTEEASMLAVSEAQQTAIEEKGAEVLATIPEDYTTTYNLANESSRTKADAIICSSEGEVITVNDSSNDNLRGLSIYGKTTQISTTGAQLADFTGGNCASGVTKTFNNDTLVVAGDGSLTHQSWSTSILDNIQDKQGQLLYFDYESFESTAELDGTVIQLNISKSDGTKEYIGLQHKSGSRQTYTIPSDITELSSVSLAIYTTNTTTAQANTITIVKPMLQIGTDTIPYETYSGGYASPRPEWPQTMTNVGVEGVNIIINTTNLLDVTAFELGTNEAVIVSDDLYTITAIGGVGFAYGSSSYALPDVLVKALRGKSVYLACDSFTTAQEINVRMGLNITREDGSMEYPGSLGVNNAWRVFTIPSDATRIQASLYTNNTGATLDTNNTVTLTGIRLSTITDVEWEPHSMQTGAIDRALPGIPVSTGGNYTDSDGQQWICDEIDFENGVYKQRVLQLTYNGSETENWKLGYSSNGVSNRFQTMITNDSIANEVWSENTSAVVVLNAFCDKFRNQVTSMLPDSDCFRVSHSISADSSQWYLLINPDTSVVALEDLDAWLVWLAENPITLYLPLTKPIETALTADEIAAFQALKSNYPNTTVLNDAGAGMKLRYNADTETWVNNLIDAKIAAALANL